MQCVACGAANPEGPDVRFCRSCGAALLPASASAATVPPQLADGYAPVPSAAPTGGSNGQVSPAAPLVPVVRIAPEPSVVHVAVSPYGGFWIRLVAWAIDQVILVGTDLIALFTLGFAAEIVASLADAELDTGMPSEVVWLVIFVVAIPYSLLFPPLLGATPGKLMLGYHVVDERGRHISLKRSLGRMLAQIPSGIVLGLGYAWIGFDSRKQGWHDQIARTFVLRKELVRS